MQIVSSAASVYVQSFPDAVQPGHPAAFQRERIELLRIRAPPGHLSASLVPGALHRKAKILDRFRKSGGAVFSR